VPAGGRSGMRPFGTWPGIGIVVAVRGGYGTRLAPVCLRLRIGIHGQYTFVLPLYMKRALSDLEEARDAEERASSKGCW
jgi:hypothetical protein